MSELCDALESLARIRAAFKAQSPQVVEGVQQQQPEHSKELAKRLRLSEDLSRRLFARAQALEAALLQAKNAPSSSAVRNNNARGAESGDPASRSAHDHSPCDPHEVRDLHITINRLKVAAAADRATISQLVSRVKLLESGVLTSKLKAAAMAVERADQSHQRLSSDYKILAASRAKRGDMVARALGDRIEVLEKERIEEVADFSARVFAAEQLACAAFTAQAASNHEAEALRAEVAETEVISRRTLERLRFLEEHSSGTRLRAPT